MTDITPGPGSSTNPDREAQKVLVVIPTLNERENLQLILPAIWKHLPEAHILISNDPGHDGTQPWIQNHPEHGKKLFLRQGRRRRGLAHAYLRCFREITAGDRYKNYTHIVQMDADGSHDPRALPQLVAATTRLNPVTLGSRYLGGIRVINWTPKRLMLSIFGGAYARLFTPCKLTDPTSGFKCFHTGTFAQCPWNHIHSKGYAFQIEVNLWFQANGIKIKEIPITFTDRSIGTSKMSHAIAWEAALIVPLIGAKYWGYKLCNPPKTNEPRQPQHTPHASPQDNQTQFRLAPHPQGPNHATGSHPQPKAHEPAKPPVKAN